MNARFLSITTAALLGLAAEAGAREAVAVPSAPARSADEALPLMLAQAREVELYYDRYGREVLVDAYTGEVISIREPRGAIRRPAEPVPREERYYLDDPEDMARLRREKRMEELGRSDAPFGGRVPIIRDFREVPAPAEPGYDDGYEPYEEDFAREGPGFEELREPGFEEPGYEEPEYSERGFEELPEPGREPGAVVRAPLDDSSIIAAPDDGTSESIIENAPQGGLPDVTQPPAMSLSGAQEDIAKIQIVLDRVGASPGVIDGRIGDNVNKAIDAYRAITGETMRTYDKEFIQAALEETGGDAFIEYEITSVDVAGPFVASVPTDYGEKAQMQRLGFVSVAEMLAERFHMDERYLRELNPGVDFDRPGTIVKVANVEKALTGKVARIVADKGARQVRTYDEGGDLVAVYPSTIGSEATPSPSGTHTVERVAFDPQYTYNPKINFKQGDNDEVLTIPPGPNGPVGTVWIALSKPTYGIHGTPDPSKIGKTESNGCIRLTNWDAQELAKMVEPGTEVEFVE